MSDLYLLKKFSPVFDPKKILLTVCSGRQAGYHTVMVQKRIEKLI